MCSQLFQLFDSNKDGVIEFGEFIRGLSVFHPAAPQAQKTDCKISSENCVSLHALQYFILKPWCLMWQLHFDSMIYVKEALLNVTR